LCVNALTDPESLAVNEPKSNNPGTNAGSHYPCIHVVYVYTTLYYFVCVVWVFILSLVLTLNILISNSLQCLVSWVDQGLSEEKRHTKDN